MIAIRIYALVRGMRKVGEGCIQARGVAARGPWGGCKRLGHLVPAELGLDATGGGLGGAVGFIRRTTNSDQLGQLDAYPSGTLRIRIRAGKRALVRDAG